MKNLKSSFLFLFFFITMCFHLNGQKYTPVIQGIASGSTTYSNLPISVIRGSDVPLKLDYSSSGAPSDYKPFDLFWRFEEGQYSQGYQLNPTHAFFGNSNVEVWTIDTYDEEEDPPKSFVFNGIVTATGSTPPTLKMSTINNLSIRQVWLHPMYGDEMLYVVTVDNLCSDSIRGTLRFEVISPTNSTISNIFIDRSFVGTIPNGKRVNTTLPPGQTTEFLVGFDIANKKTKTQSDIISVKASFLETSKELVCGKFPFSRSSEILGVQIKDSHDPNLKTVISPEALCYYETDSEFIVEYKIDFENIGEGPAEYVTIVDWLDEKDYLLDIQETGAEFPGTYVFYSNLNKGTARWNFDFRSNPLRGTKEEGYISAFPKEDAESWLTFKVRYRKEVLDKIGFCSALMNNARITFDCNPEMYTETSFLLTMCDSTEEGCIGCSEKNQVKIDTLELNGEQQRMLPAVIQSKIQAQNPNKFNWYPDFGLSDPNSLNPIFDPLETTTYHLVFGTDSNGGDLSCERYVYSVKVVADDYGRTKGNPMKILDDNNPNDCTCTPVIIGGSPPYNYKWSDGSTGSPLIGTTSGSYGLTVTDAHKMKVVDNGTIKYEPCAAKATFQLRCKDVVDPGGWATVSKPFLLAIVFFLLLLLFFFLRRRG